MDYSYTFNIQAQANTIEDLFRAMDEVKEQVVAGYPLAKDKDETRRYALSIEKEEHAEDEDGK